MVKEWEKMTREEQIEAASELGVDELLSLIVKPENVDPVESPTARVDKVINMYTPEGQKSGSTTKFAKEEKQYAGPDTLVFSHPHPYDEDCSKKCKEITEA